MSSLRALIDRPEAVWTILALPAIPVLALLMGDNPRAIHIAVHPTGEWAARFLILAMMATPLMLLLKGWRGPRWLMKNRRYLGVAAFAYALAHTIFYLLDKGLGQAIDDLPKLYIWTGWIAFAIFIPLAATSMDWAVRRLGTAWKPLQRWVYGAAVLTLVHWAALHDWGSVAPAMVHFGPLIALEAYRVWWIWLRPRPARA
jgi:methionine sulfoxide reductase heme-binding subunit